MVDNLLVRSLTYIHTATVSRRIRLEHGNRYFREPFAVCCCWPFFYFYFINFLEEEGVGQ